MCAHSQSVRYQRVRSCNANPLFTHTYGSCLPRSSCPQKYPIIDVRGRGLMLAAEFGGVDGRLTARPHTAADITHAAAKRGMLLMGAGARLAAFGDCLSLFLVRCIDVPRGVGGTLWQRQACCSWGQVGGCFCRLIKAAGLQRKKSGEHDWIVMTWHERSLLADLPILPTPLPIFRTTASPTSPAGARETIRFLPPLNISAAEVDEGLAIFERCLEDVFAPAPVL